MSEKNSNAYPKFISRGYVPEIMHGIFESYVHRICNCNEKSPYVPGIFLEYADIFWKIGIL